MRSETIAALKIEMGYTETPAPSCMNCKHSRKGSVFPPERSVDRVCAYNPIGAMDVENWAHCNKFEPKG